MFESIRGPNVVAVWEELAQELDASFENSGLFHPEMTIVAPLDDSHIAIDTHSTGFGNSRVDYTRIRAPCTVPEDAWMNVEPSGFVGRAFRKLSRKPGMEVEDPSFDDKHVVDGSSAAFVRSLLADQDVRCRLAEAPFQSFRVTKNDPVLILKVGQKKLARSLLALQIVGVVKDKERLLGYVSMFRAVLSRLEAQRTASPTDQERLRPVERPRLEPMKQTVDAELSWLSAVTERTANGNETHLRLEHGGQVFVAVVDVTTPRTPRLDCDVTLRAKLPGRGSDDGEPLDFEVRTASGVAATLVNLADTKIGHPLVDKEFVIKAAPAAIPLLQSCTPQLMRLRGRVGASAEIRFQFADGELIVTASNLHADVAATVIVAIGTLWSDFCRASLEAGVT